MRSRLLPLLGIVSPLVIAAACGSNKNLSGVGSGDVGGAGGDFGVTTGTSPSATGQTTTGAGLATSSGTNSGSGGASTSATGTGTSSGGSMGSSAPGASSGAGGGCMMGTADCNANSSDGCEANIESDTNNCGACGKTCPSGPNTAAQCSVGVCGLACGAGFGDCDKNAANGCEVNTNSDPKNCGVCGNDCMAAACVQGACACAAETQTAQLVQLDLFIMLDQSGSMTDPVGDDTQDKWQTVTEALDSFFANPQNANLGVGIQYFGLPPSSTPPEFCSSDADCGAYGPCDIFICDGSDSTDSCSAGDYSKAEVEIAPLTTAQATALSNSIAAHSPTTDTPTAPALQGAIDHAEAWDTSHPTHETVVILATDGDPEECSPQDIPSIANIAAAGVTAGVKTFVIGVGPDAANLNALAVGGGTTSAFLVDTSGNVVQEFTAALQAIQKSALGCQYNIPKPAMGTLNYNKINVQYTPGTGTVEALGNVANAAACGSTGGWYYDNNTTPTKILLCPTTCTTVSGDKTGQVQVLLGCATKHM